VVVNQTVLVCQHNACRKAGAKQVLTAFQKLPLMNVKIEPVRCLGQCGNGPMVLVLPEGIWYGKVAAAEVPAVIEQHLQCGKPIKAMLYQKFHANG